MATADTDHARTLALSGSRTGTGTSTPILLYHSVTRGPAREANRFACSVSDFSAQLDAVEASGASMVTISDLMARRANADGAPSAAPGDRQPHHDLAAITFDDGFADNLSVAAPLLCARGIPATVYVTTSYLTGHRPQARVPMLSVAGVLELAAAGIEIGSHGVHHRPLDQLSSRSVAADLTRSKYTLEDLLGMEIRTFAYPHGHHRGRTRTLVGEAGYASACAVGNAVSGVDDDRFALARLTIENRHSSADVARMMTTGPAGHRIRLRSALGSVRRRTLAMLEVS